MKILLSYPGIMPAAAQVAQAFYEHDLLHSFETTFVYEPKKPLDRAIGTLLPARLRSELSRRTLSSLPAGMIHRHPSRDLLRIALSRLGASDVTLDRWWEKTIIGFDRAVAGELPAGISAIYGYEHACRYSFEEAARRGLRCIYDMAAPHFSFFESVTGAENRARPGEFGDEWKKIRGQDNRRNVHKQKEFDLSDLVIANSSFTAKTLIDTGFSPERVRVVPLGGPSPSRAARGSAEKPTFLFVGNNSLRKGVHYLLEAWKMLNAGGEAELVLAGQLPSTVEIPRGVRRLGNVPYEQLSHWYGKSSLVILPSLCDGFGMVVTEALSQGVPVLTTTHTGASDLIEEGENGWVVAPADAVALAEKMQWCLSHPEELPRLREKALQSAAENTWAHYRQRLVATIREFFGSV